MEKKLVENKTANAMHVGPYTIYPGQSRMVEPFYLGIVQHEAPAQSLDEWLAKFVTGTQKAIAEDVPNLTHEQVYALREHIYSSDKEFKTVDKVLDKHIESLGETYQAYAFAQDLKSKTDEELQVLLLDHADHDVFLPLLQAELSERDAS